MIQILVLHLNTRIIKSLLVHQIFKIFMIVKKKYIKFYLAFFVFILFTQCSYAQGNPLLSTLFGKSNQIAKDSVKTSTDTLFFSTSFSSYLIKPYPVKNLISFQIREDQDNILPATFKAIVHLRIYYTMADNHKDSVDDVRLVLNYDSASSYGAQTNFIFNNAYRVKIKVLSDTIPASVMPALLINNEIIPDRKYAFGC